MPKFVILMRENDNAWAKLPQREQSRLLSMYGLWAKQLQQRGQLVSGEALGRGGTLLTPGAGGFVSSRAYEETLQVETGYFVIEAPDLAAATDIARECPALLHGETVVVRPVGDA